MLRPLLKRIIASSAQWICWRKIDPLIKEVRFMSVVLIHVYVLARCTLILLQNEGLIGIGLDWRDDNCQVRSANVSRDTARRQSH